MKSIYERYRDARRTASNQRALAAECSNPQTRHEIEVSALAAEKESAVLAEAIDEVESLIFDTCVLISALRHTRHSSPHITLALRHAEDAESRLHRELGQP